MYIDFKTYNINIGGYKMNLPRIPKEEFEVRRKKLQEKMKEEGYDLLFIYANDGAVFGQEHTRYLFNYTPHFEDACILMPAEGEALLVTGYESEEYVKTSSFCRNVQVVEEFNYGAHDFPFANVVSLKEAIQNVQTLYNKPVEKMGVIGKEKMTIDFYYLLLDAIDNKNLDEVDQMILDLRLYKTDNEIKVIEYAYYIAEKGMEAAINAIKVGKTEREIAAEAEYVMRNLGSEGMGIDTMVASGSVNSAPIIARTTFKQIEQNELVVLTIAPRYEGYHAAIARPVILGEVNPAVEEAIKAAIRAQEIAQELLVPGNNGSEVDSASRKVVAEKGLEKHFVYTGGHSIGVSEFEPPSLNASFKQPIAENMVFSVDIPIFFNDWGGFRYENGFHITADGARPLQKLDKDVIRIQ